MNKPLKLLLLGTAVAQMTGCASLEWLAVGGVSYLLTGKGLSDHALSMTMDKDCAFHRVLTQGNFCNDSLPEEVSPETMVAQIPSASGSKIENLEFPNVSDTVNTSHIEAVLVAEVPVVTAFDNANEPGEPESQAIASHYLNSDIASADDLIHLELPDKVDTSPQVYAVVGSFQDLKYAFERSILYRVYNTQIIETSENRDTRYRVVVGPLNSRDLIEQIPNKVTNGQPHWAIELCEDSLLPPPCGSQMLARNG